MGNIDTENVLQLYKQPQDGNDVFRKSGSAIAIIGGFGTVGKL